MPKVNGFVMYMDSVKNEVAPGQSLKRNELALLCADGWKELPEEQKKKFAEQAKRFNERKSGQAPKPVPKKVSEDPEMGSDADHEAMEAGRQVVCQIFEQTDWRNQPIVVCHFSLYVEPDYAEHFIPAEIGLATFSLNEGVTDNFSRIIEPGKLPQGYGIEAVHTAINLGLPDLDTIPEFADYGSTMMIVDSYLKQYAIKLSRGEKMYVFAFDSEYVRVKRCFEWLYNKIGYRLQIQILSLDLWCYMSTTYSAREARNAPAKSIPGAVFQKERSVRATTNKFREADKPLAGKFVYHSRFPMCAVGIFLKDEDVDPVIRDVDNYRCFEEMCCMYHMKNGLQIHHCALNNANRYAFSILEIITLSNEVPIIRGQHYPEVDNPPVEKARRHNMLAKWGITRFEEEMEVRRHEDVGPPTPAGRGFNNARERNWEDRNRNGDRRQRGPPRHPRRQERLDEQREDERGAGAEVEEEGEGDYSYSPMARAAFVPRPGPRVRSDSEGASGPPEDHGLRLYKMRDEDDDEDYTVRLVTGGANGERGEPSRFTGKVPSFFGQPKKQ